MTRKQLTTWSVRCRPPSRRGFARLPRGRAPTADSGVTRLGGMPDFAVGVGSPPTMCRWQNIENKHCPWWCLPHFQSLPRVVVGVATLLPSRRLLPCLCDAVSPVAAPRGRRRVQQLNNIEHIWNPTIFKVFNVLVPGRRLGQKLKTCKTAVQSCCRVFVSRLRPLGVAAELPL